MTTEEVLAACRSNWAYRGVDEASMHDMLDELAAHLEDAAHAGRTPQDVVGDDVKAFAAAWAQARTPLPRRALRMVAMASFATGALVLLTLLLHRTTEMAVTADRITYFAAIATATVVWELRRGSLGMRRSWAVALLVGLPVLLLTRHFAGDDPLLTVPLWAGAALLAPGVPFVLADARAKRAAR
ncbi:hypothetical protein AB0469_29360 [Streptomyces sp. NPDC093801]|uniref:hypothetical protein n=1 Tax=Streptomyces sp. NPDC093801 TaxID=3155203 RepID=UPI00344C88DE